MARSVQLLTIATVLVLSAAALACNVPVFRFALERWRPDPYRITIFHRGALTDAEREHLVPLQEQQDKSLSNFAIRMVDVTQLSKVSDENVADGELFAALGDPPLPLAVVQYPPHLRIQLPVWAGPLEREALGRLTDSPARQELVRRLADGHTAVWLLLESGVAERDDAAAALLEQELEKLEQELKLPELTSAPEDELLTQTPLKVAFSLLRVPRSLAEEGLVAMLVRSEPDLAERSDPMVFPVFGRGRALLPLIGAGITPQNIHDAASFLVGPCSCQVKEQNPGFDLLLTADWDALLSQKGVPLSAIQTRSLQPPDEAELVPIPSGAPQSEATTFPLVVSQSYEIGRRGNSIVSIQQPLTWIVGGIAILGALLIAGVAIVMHSSRQAH